MALERTIQVIEAGMAEGLHRGAQIYASVGKRIVADMAVGQAVEGVAMRPDTVMPWRSAGKPIAAVAIGQLHDRGLLDWDDPVTRFIPDFAPHGKDRITIRHLLTHTAGLRHMGNLPLESLFWARVEPRWELGLKAGYHPWSTWILLGEIIHRADGRSFCEYVRQAIFEPLGMDDCWFAITTAQYHQEAHRIGVLDETMDSPEVAAMCRPASSARGPIHALGRFYEMLLDGGEGIISPGTIDELTRPQRVGIFDHTFKFVTDWGLGFMTNSQPYDPGRPYGYGPYASPRAFGHGGAQSSIAFADPASRLVAGVVFSGTPGEVQHRVRMDRTLAALYEDLQLA